MAETFVERRFELRVGGAVTVHLFRPEPDGDDWRCAYRIIWPDRERRSQAFGVDGLQALFLAMQKVHADLLASPENKAGALTWLAERDLGLPLPRGLEPDDFA